MTVDHHTRVVQVFGHKFLVVNHKEPAFLNLKCQAFQYIFFPFFIVIAANDVDRGDFLQASNDFRPVDITAMNDDIAVDDTVDDLQPENTVGVRDNGYGFRQGGTLEYSMTFLL